jgi:hypothetical protein
VFFFLQEREQQSAKELVLSAAKMTCSVFRDGTVPALKTIRTKHDARTYKDNKMTIAIQVNQPRPYPQ